MTQLVCMGAMMSCSFGTAPASLIVARTTLAGVVPAANIMDYKPVTNVPTFAMCSSLSNPTVSTATTAASGVLTPMPCVPATAAPWTVGKPTVLIDNQPALNKSSTLTCSYGGTIQFTYAGQTKDQFG